MPTTTLYYAEQVKFHLAPSINGGLDEYFQMLFHGRVRNFALINGS